MLENAKWISYPEDTLYHAPVFKRCFEARDIKKATLQISSLGCYEAEINGLRVGDFILAPGCTSRQRVQVQSYDVTDLIKEKNEIRVTLSKGWFKGRINPRSIKELPDMYEALICQLELTHNNGNKVIIVSDENWLCAKSKITFADIYDGERCDMTYNELFVNVRVQDYPHALLVPQQGEYIKEQETILPHRIFTTPKGELIVDFNQNMTGYIEVNATAKAGDVISLSFAEILDKDGNFYTENYRSAKCEYHYTCQEGENTYKPRHTFYGFRYVRVDSFPNELTEKSIRAIVVHSDIKRTGYLNSSSPLLNKLFSNIIWGQKSNFLDIPTDCPQRDERAGWTGDAEIFVKTATYNYDVERFFEKWLRDLRLDQREDGCVPSVVPQIWDDEWSRAGWGDASTICPYQIYMTYGNTRILRELYPTMCKYLKYIASISRDRYLWTGTDHFGDWLGLDAPEGSYKGSSNEDFIASAYYYYSTGIVVKVGRLLSKNVEKYEKLRERILNRIRKKFKKYRTQTECVLALHFDIAEDREAVAGQLADMIVKNGTRIQTGFIGTPYILHALSENGYTDLAYSLLLQEEYPSWLYSIKQGATTMWEHWDGINDKGELWSKDMNSFNHYAYGSVADWVYEVACGIKPLKAGFEEIVIEPHPTKRLSHLSARIDTKRGTVSSAWYREGDIFRYEITTPTDTTVIIDGKSHRVKKGSYVF
ncbi:MAG: family 78 glycoside hydrolase catalytic domain [Clostridia bacterium]|nr:family 78 glycoside hydrolase catalytic domain [Clostridia bacterium]